jgi:hypothetical protein
MQLKKKRWRVRVWRKIEDWIEVQAEDTLQAEAIAITMPGVISVFGQVIPANKAVERLPPVGVLDDEED